MNKSLRESLAWLFLASLLLLVVVWGSKPIGPLGWRVGPAVNVNLYVPAPGGGLKVEVVRLGQRELNPQSLWQRLRRVSEHGAQSLLPPGVELLEARQEDSVLVVSFSGDLVRKRYLGSNEEIALVYSIVNTLAQLPETEAVRILIEGVTVETLADHVDLTVPLSPDYSIVSD